MSMLTNKYVLAAGTVFAVIIVFFLWPSSGFAREVRSCSSESDSELIKCLDGIVRQEFKSGGLYSASAAFSYFYNHVPAFAGTCHSRGHVLGDLTYYEMYANGSDPSDVDLPSETTACFYGFFHGFFEHVFQDNPDPNFVVSTCEALAKRYEKTHRALKTTCYEAAGHGLELAYTETIPAEKWGDLDAFVEPPFKACETLPAEERFITQCKRGVLTTLSQFVANGHYGFSPEKDLYRMCDAAPNSWDDLCYRAFATSSTLPDLNTLPEHGAYLANIENRGSIVLGLMASVSQRGDRHLEELVDACTNFPDALFAFCARGIAYGWSLNLTADDWKREKILFCEEISRRDRNSELCAQNVKESSYVI